MDNEKKEREKEANSENIESLPPNNHPQRLMPFWFVVIQEERTRLAAPSARLLA